MSVATQVDEARPAADEVDDRDVLLVDLSSLFWAAWHSSGEDEISQARRRTIEGVQRCIGDLNPATTLVAICCDSGRSFRKDLHPEYKANRPEKDHSTLNELNQVIEKLRADGYRLWQSKGFEADDVIATACREAVKRGHHVIIASADKDLLQLVSPTVTALRTHNWTTMDLAAVRDRFGIEPALIGDWLALVGDASDNIKGAPGVGAKTATTLLAKHGSLDAMFAKLKTEPTSVGTPAVVRSLQANVDVVELARKLVELRADAPIDFDEIYTPIPRATQSVAEATDMDEPDPEYVDAPKPNANGTAAPQPAAAAPADAPLAPPPAAPPSAAQEMVASSPALTVMPPGTYELALEPTSLGVAFKLGQALYASRLYSRFPTAEAITAVIVRGREMGLGALTSLDVFHIIEGKPAPHAHFIISLGERHPDCEYVQLLHSDNEYAEYETKNRKHKAPIKHRYHIDDAVDAGLCGKAILPRTAGPDEKDRRGNWDKRRAEMLRKTCAVQLIRIAYPSAALGLYSIEELGGE